jgi:hypothetical protein
MYTDTIHSLNTNSIIKGKKVKYKPIYFHPPNVSTSYSPTMHLRKSALYIKPAVFNTKNGTYNSTRLYMLPI